MQAAQDSPRRLRDPSPTQTCTPARPRASPASRSDTAGRARWHGPGCRRAQPPPHRPSPFASHPPLEPRESPGSSLSPSPAPSRPRAHPQLPRRVHKVSTKASPRLWERTPKPGAHASEASWQAPPPPPGRARQGLSVPCPSPPRQPRPRLLSRFLAPCTWWLNAAWRRLAKTPGSLWPSWSPSSPWVSSAPKPLRHPPSPRPSPDLSLSGPPQKLPPVAHTLRPPLVQGAGEVGWLEKSASPLSWRSTGKGWERTRGKPESTSLPRDWRAWHFGEGQAVLPASPGASGPPCVREAAGEKSRCKPRVPATSLRPIRPPEPHWTLMAQRRLWGT